MNNTDNWPVHTTTSPADVTIAGLSLVTLVQWCGAPCVHTAAAVIRGTNGRPSQSELASVLVARIVSVSRENAQLSVWVDAELDHCAAICSETRLIGRASTAHASPAVLFPASPNGTIHRDIQNRANHPERVSDERTEAGHDVFQFAVCGR